MQDNKSGIEKLKALGLSQEAAEEIAALSEDQLEALISVLSGLRKTNRSAPLPTPWLGEIPDEIAETDIGHLLVLCSPYMGVFHPSPAPDKPPFEVGDVIEPGQVIGQIEWMMEFYDVKLGGKSRMRVVHSLASKGTSVENGQDLILLVPA